MNKRFNCSRPGRCLLKAFADGRLKTGARRSGAGTVLALLLLPALLGVMACIELPVPVGDPESSRIDPELNGVWITGSPELEAIMILDPYDQRTWLVGLLSIKCRNEGKTVSLPAKGNGVEAASSSAQGSDKQGVAVEADSAADVGEGSQACSGLPAAEALTSDKLEATGVTIVKGWLTDIGGIRFMTWEPKLMVDSDSGQPAPHWGVYRVQRNDPDELFLGWVNATVDGLGEASSREEAERILRRNLDNPALYQFGEEDKSLSDTGWRFQRLAKENYNDVASLLEAFGIEPLF